MKTTPFRQNLSDLTNLDIEFSSYSMSSIVTRPTVERMRKLAAQGYRFVVGNHPRPGRTVYGCPVADAVKVTQTSHRHHGKSIRTIWAIPARFIVLTASCTPSSSCNWPYGRVAVVERDPGFTAIPKMISTHARGVRAIVETWENCSVGTTERCAFARAKSAARCLAAKLNQE